MAYINFKEETYKGKIELEKRIKNNKKICKNISRCKNISNTYTPDKKLSFNNFNNILFGLEDKKVEDEFKEISYSDIICTTFESCKFNNIKFYECNFIGCNFINCEFSSGGATFENCSFYKENSDRSPNLNIKDNFSCHFKDCFIYAKFLNCMLNYCIFEKCNIENSSFILSDMNNIIFIDSEIYMLTLSDVNLSSSKFINNYFNNLSFEDKYCSKLDEKTFFDKINLREKTRDEYEGIYMVYETIANKFNENKLKYNFGEFYYLAKSTEYKTLSPIPKIGSFISKISCGYGERPIYAIYLSVGIIFAFSILYLAIGIEIDDTIYTISTLFTTSSLRQFFTLYNESLNLSVGMFAGVGFNNAKPIPASYMLTNIEMLLGVIMMGLGVATLTKKVVR